MNICTTAWKNMFRHKRRTIIAVWTVALAVFFSLWIDAELFGESESSKENLVSYETSSAKIYAEGYFGERATFPSDILIEAKQGKNIESFLDNANVSAVYTPRYVSNCEIIFREDFFEVSGSVNGILYGVDPLKEANVYRTPSNISEGEWLTRNPANASSEFSFVEGLVIGSWLAKDIQAQIGNYVTVVCKGRGGFMQTIDVPITGIVQTENPVVNSTALYMDLAYLDYMLELDGAVSEYSVDLGSLNVIDSQYEKLSSLTSALPEKIELYSWRDISADYIAMMEANAGIYDAVILIIFLIAAIGIANTILMTVMERKNEIGMLRTLGYSKGYIKRLFVAEGLCIGMIGAIVGILLSLPLNYYMVEIGIYMAPDYGESNGNYRITGTMRSAWNLQAYILFPIAALIVSALSAYIPSGSVLRQEIASIFRKV